MKYSVVAKVKNIHVLLWLSNMRMIIIALYQDVKTVGIARSWWAIIFREKAVKVLVWIYDISLLPPSAAGKLWLTQLMVSYKNYDRERERETERERGKERERERERDSKRSFPWLSVSSESPDRTSINATNLPWSCGYQSNLVNFAVDSKSNCVSNSMTGDHGQDLNADNECCNSEGFVQSNEENEEDEDETREKVNQEEAEASNCEESRCQSQQPSEEFHSTIASGDFV